MFGRLVGWSSQRWADINVTLAFEDAQVIPPFSREETEHTDDTDDTDDTDEICDTDDTDDTDDTGIGRNRRDYAGIGWNRVE